MRRELPTEGAGSSSPSACRRWPVRASGAQAYSVIQPRGVYGTCTTDERRFCRCVLKFFFEPSVTVQRSHGACVYVSLSLSLCVCVCVCARACARVRMLLVQHPCSWSNVHGCIFVSISCVCVCFVVGMLDFFWSACVRMLCSLMCMFSMYV